MTASTPASAARTWSRLGSLVALTSLTALFASCGGGGGDAGGPAPSPAPAGDGPAWTQFGGDAQHAANAGIATQDLNRKVWSRALDLAPPFRAGNVLLAHYGAPVITAKNTVLLPVKTTTAGAFRVDAVVGGSGADLWSLTTDYVLPPHNWNPSYNLALNAAGRVYAPGAGGRLLYRDNADSATGAWQSAAFYGNAAYAAASATYDASVFINTPITLDAAGNAYFGYVVTGANPSGLTGGGIARIGADGAGSFIPATTATNDAGIAKAAMNSAPALSPDGQTLYAVVNMPLVAGQTQRGALVALDAATLAVKRSVALTEPALGAAARIGDDGTSSVAVGPDGDVYIGVLEPVFGTHNARGWLLHFDATLTSVKTPGSFGWDNTPSIVPAAAVPGYAGTSAYLLLSKYNNYAGAGSGDGQNRVAILDPNATQADPITPAVQSMKEVITILGPTADPAGGAGAVKEWCVNTAAVDPLTKSVLINSEDGMLYRWDLATNAFTQKIALNGPLGQAYTPTVVGADGAVYAVNNATVYAIGR